MTRLERKQRTLSSGGVYSGIGIHTGKQVTMRWIPAPVGTGIRFRRVGLPVPVEIPATVEYLVDTNRCTTIGVGDVAIHTIEHVMSALHAYRIDNLIVEVDEMEPPVGDGSSLVFVELIEQCGVEEQEETVEIAQLREPVYWSEGEVHIVAIPDSCFRVSYTLHYPLSKVLRAQYCSFEVNEKSFKEEIAPCRTFSLYEEVSYLMDRGLIKGGSLANAVVIKEDVILSKEELRFENEMARHKTLDIIGDTALLGMPFYAHIIAIRSGHAANCAFAQKLKKQIIKEICS